MNLPPNPNPETGSIAFEVAFNRLEEILAKLSTGTVSLDESLTLYEEADQLIRTCSTRLNEAERKIEILIKNRHGEPILGRNEEPMTQDFKIT